MFESLGLRQRIHKHCFSLNLTFYGLKLTASRLPNLLPYLNEKLGNIPMEDNCWVTKRDFLEIYTSR